jgi:hypothetical protein
LILFVVFLGALPSGLLPSGFLPKFWEETLKERDRCGDLGVNERIILKLILNK